jgi:glycosyltransferase involved in cell wall biosynthesis
MPRIGMNPARGKDAEYTPARVTVCVLTHLPHMDGYFQERLDVTKLCLESILANTSLPFDLMVFDNGSCPELVDHLKDLRQRGFIDFLFLSRHNIGKMGALQMMFHAAPGEVIAYTDDDIYHLPGWLEKHLEILDTYPRTGLITGFYIRSRMDSFINSTLKFAENPEVEVKMGKFIPHEWEEEYVANAGRTWERYAQEIGDLEDMELRYRGVPALVSAHHFQFVTPKHVILSVLPEGWTGKLMGLMLKLEETIDNSGYLRLTTREQTMHLLGNSLSPEMQARAKELGMDIRPPRMTEESGGLLRWLARRKLPRQLMQAIYNRLHVILNR